jgi:putative Mn2+ efflux pump MntP
MRTLLPVVISLAWGLWFGGIIMVFIAVQTVFAAFDPDRQTAGFATSRVFLVFEWYQLALAAVLLAALIAWRLMACTRLKRWLLVLAIGAAALAVTSTAIVTPRIESMREQGQTGVPEFRRLHGVSMLLYTGTSVLLLGAGVLIPLCVRAERDR